MPSQPLTPFPAARDRPTLTVPTAGAYLGLSRSQAYAAAARGDLPTIRLGRRLVVPTASLAKLLDLTAVVGEGN